MMNAAPKYFGDLFRVNFPSSPAYHCSCPILLHDYGHCIWSFSDGIVEYCVLRVLEKYILIPFEGKECTVQVRSMMRSLRETPLARIPQPRGTPIASAYAPGKFHLS